MYLARCTGELHPDPSGRIHLPPEALDVLTFRRAEQRVSDILWRPPRIPQFPLLKIPKKYSTILPESYVKNNQMENSTMLHISICDDEKDFVTYLTTLLEQYAAEMNKEIKITPYYDGMELIEKYDPTIDLIFLDIQMKRVNGLRTAEHIRQLDENVSIIFLTTLTQYSLEGYRYQATNYIIKPIKYLRLKTELNQWLKKHQKDNNPSIIVANHTGKYKIFLKSLRYIETFNRNLLLHTETESKEPILCYKNMKEMERILEEKGFARCHTSYLVNLAYIKNIKKLEITLITGETIPISQPKRKEFTERLTEYWGDLL